MAVIDQTTSPRGHWTSAQAYTLAVITLAIGVVAGWLVRGSQSQPAATAPEATSAEATAPTGMGQQMPTSEQMKRMADKQAEPLLAQLKSNPNDPALLANLGNIYYDTQQYKEAIDYYQRSLKIQPQNASTRTDMATAYWYLHDPDSAIAEFNKALTYDPNQPNTLLNLGIVKWQGKMDVNGAVAAWEKLLQTNPNYEHKDKVQELIAEAKKHSNVKPGTQAKPLQ
jgi:cytochrome c-type biogenesis protein CcmH/NrfG